MCKEMQIIPVNRVVDPKRTIEKMEGQGEGEAQGVADPPPKKKTNFGYTADILLSNIVLLSALAKMGRT
jgi:hypothetical protein